MTNDKETGPQVAGTTSTQPTIRGLIQPLRAGLQSKYPTSSLDEYQVPFVDRFRDDYQNEDRVLLELPDGTTGVSTAAARSPEESTCHDAIVGYYLAEEETDTLLHGRNDGAHHLIIGKAEHLKVATYGDLLAVLSKPDATVYLRNDAIDRLMQLIADDPAQGPARFTAVVDRTDTGYLNVRDQGVQEGAEAPSPELKPGDPGYRYEDGCAWDRKRSLILGSVEFVNFHSSPPTA